MPRKPHTGWDELPLWEHQREALDILAEYLASPRGGSALIRMPTGTGKTGVIAVATRCFPEVNTVLIVAPWAALRDQLLRDLETRFWKRIDVDPDAWPISAQRLLPSTIAGQLKKAEDEQAAGKKAAGKKQAAAKKTAPTKTAYVGTIPALQAVYARDRTAFAALSQAVDLVIVDEGHREPAPMWAEAVRALNKPTVLMTATPYRNDHKLFNVRQEFVYAYHHHRAVEDRYIRETRFHEFDFPKSPAAFVDRLLQFHRETFDKSTVNNRVIVRCQRDTEVNAIGRELRRRQKSVVAIHERFEKESHYAQAVPDPDKHHAQFWVHQNKLIEGIDDPRFSLLAIYGAFTNARALVQQVGRVLRNPTRAAGQMAHVFAFAADRQHAYWEGYRHYEQDFEHNPTRVQVRQQFFTAVQQQPEFEYVDGTYRRRFDVDQQPMYKAFKYPQTANVYSLNRRFNGDTFRQSLLDEWRKLDREILCSEQPDPETWVHTYVSAGNSQLLMDQALLHYQLGYTIYRRDQGFLFFYDTGGAACERLADMAQTISPALLQRLFAGDKSRLSQLSLINTDLGRQSIRRRSLQAHSVSETAPGLVDHIHFCSTASGYAGSDARKLLRRYVGFTKGRVSDKNLDRVDFAGYLRWMDRVAAALRRQSESEVELFDRFADFVPPPEEPDARNILFDLDDVLDVFETTISGQLLASDDLCMHVGEEEPGYFKWRLNNRTYDVRVAYNAKRKRYELESKQLERDYVRTEGTGHNLVAQLNRDQSFRIVPSAANVIYAHGRFYAPKLRLGGSQHADKLDLFHIFETVPKLAGLNHEKFPARRDHRGWTAGTVFHLIDSCGRGTELEALMRGINVLVCDDAGSNEVADFIAADTRQRRIVLIHGKAARETRLLSASAFADVCNQAVKNLDILTPFSTVEPPNLRRWGSPWRTSWERQEQVVTRRLRKGASTPAAAWNELRSIIRDPSATREVWVVVGSTFSRKEFRAAAEQSSQPPEVIQILYSLQSTWGAISSVGARLRVFCSP